MAFSYRIILIDLDVYNHDTLLIEDSVLQKATVPTSTEGTTLVKADGKIAENAGDKEDPVSARLAQIYKRLELIDAYSAEARASAILAVSIVCLRMLSA